MQDDAKRTEMFGLLSTIHENQFGHLYTDIKREDLKYVIYLRKSSDESSGKQTKSNGDQFTDIKSKILDVYKITNYDVVEGEHSAKEADTRTEFTEMLDALRRGDYQGLIAWHPDRLARNMREAGEIIDMLDKYQIKDLLFAAASYEDNANGKMMLGITFALSKQYSEHLSKSVLRGYGRRIDEGKYLGKMVHGYRIVGEGFLEPDGKNWQIIQQAFRKRLQSNPESLTDIAKWLNKQDYTQCYGRKQVRNRTSFNDKKLSELLRESVYAGFLQYGQAKPVDLTKLYGFEPMIEADDYLKLNKIKDISRIVSRGNVLAHTKLIKLLQGKVTCGHCGSNMHPNTGTGKTKAKTYVYFRCDDKDCWFKNENPKNPKHYKHQMRAHIVTNAAIDTLKEAEFDLNKAYENYAVGAKEAVEAEKIELLSQERRLRADLQNAKADLQKAKDVVADPSKADVAKYYEADIKKYIETEIPKYTKELAELERRKEGVKQSIYSEEKFLKLIAEAVNYIGELLDLEQIDEILQKFYSNFIVLDKAVSVITFNQEWYDVLNPVWLGMRDSNPRSWDQNPVPYRLANPQ
jgi:DNA invertase Pin-like site-specific DNA recombinase